MKQPNKKSNIPAKVLKTSHKLLWEEGYTNMSLNDLVSKTKISKGGLFHYFPNKKTIIMQVLDEYVEEEIFGRLTRNLDGATSGIEIKVALMNWLEDYYKSYSKDHFKKGCMLGNIALETANQDEELREYLKTVFIQWENKLVTYLRPLTGEGRLLMEARQFARLLIAMIEGITMTSKVHRDQNRAARDFQALAEFIERMIRD